MRAGAGATGSLTRKRLTTVARRAEGGLYETAAGIHTGACDLVANPRIGRRSRSWKLSGNWFDLLHVHLGRPELRPVRRLRKNRHVHRSSYPGSGCILRTAGVVTEHASDGLALFSLTLPEHVVAQFLGVSTHGGEGREFSAEEFIG